MCLSNHKECAHGCLQDRLFLDLSLCTLVVKQAMRISDPALELKFESITIQYQLECSYLRVNRVDNFYSRLLYTYDVRILVQLVSCQLNLFDNGCLWRLMLMTIRIDILLIFKVVLHVIIINQTLLKLI